MKITMDYDKSVNFGLYKSFAIAKLEMKNISISQLNAERITNAIKDEMKKKGFREDPENPDITVNPITILKDEKTVTAYTDYYGYGGYYRPYGWGGGMGTGTTTYNVQNYINGSLIIEVIDAKSQKLIWEGIGNKQVDGPLKNPDVQIPAAVAKIMAGFPPGVAKAK
jgi:hypothetical protein